MKTPLFLLLLLFFGNVSGQTRTYDTLPNLPDHYIKRCELFKKEPIRQGRVVMLGNSITEGANWKVLLNDTTIINRGISGDVTFGVLNRIADITERKPSKLFILIGINDLSRNTPDEIIVENIFKIVSKIKSGSPGTVIYVQSILPTNETFKNLHKNYFSKGEHVTVINNRLKKNEKKLPYQYVDLYTNFLDAEGRMDARYSADGLHLNQAGYEHWVKFLKKEKYF